MEAEAPVVGRAISYYYGDGERRRQILHGIDIEVAAGEIVILTGPSGSGKTTLLTLAGALRSMHEGSLHVLGHELNGADTRLLAQVRGRIGYIFQSHNLLRSLNAVENVEMPLRRDPLLTWRERRRAAEQALGAVGLDSRIFHYPDQLSGGQKQRVAIARALVGRPRLILADEPTASLDRQSGRDAIDLIQRLAKGGACSVLLVTHDNRIFDAGDRIIHLEDGRMQPVAKAAVEGAKQVLTLWSKEGQAERLPDLVRRLPIARFVEMFKELTHDFEQSLSVLERVSARSFNATLDRVIEALTFKIGQALTADRATLFLIDRARDEIWSKVAETDGTPLDIRLPIGEGIAGHVAETGEPVIVNGVAQHPKFYRAVDARTGYRTQRILCAPVRDREGTVIGVIQLLNKVGSNFDERDLAQVVEFAEMIAPILATWRHLVAVRPAATGPTSIAD
jgi:putative ABC transport system ATP-binding protein